MLCVHRAPCLGRGKCLFVGYPLGDFNLLKYRKIMEGGEEDKKVLNFDRS